MRYGRRLSNFKVFRKHLSVPLVAVELAFSEEFELQEQDADVLVQLRGGAVLWQKERLLNVALKVLPPSCRKVAWLDCDIVFRTADWATSARALLDEVAIVQLFKQVHYLPAHGDTDRPVGEGEFCWRSAAYRRSTGVPAAESFASVIDESSLPDATGCAWAARRELLDRHGFYDGCIMGGGDRAIICGAHGCFDPFMDRLYMNEPQRQSYLSWAEPFYSTVNAESSFVEADLLHLWHGESSNRMYRARHEGLQRFGFNPSRDIAIRDNGSWRWTTDKPEMHDYVRQYFCSRREDG